MNFTFKITLSNCEDKPPVVEEVSLDDVEELRKLFETTTMSGPSLSDYKKELRGPVEFAILEKVENEKEKKILEGMKNTRRFDSDRYKGNKPKRVYAKITLAHFLESGGEKTGDFQKLSNIIKDRGYPSGNDPDDCGHIIAAKFCGKMVDFNLIPMRRSTNQGHHSKETKDLQHNKRWRHIETSMEHFFKMFPGSEKPIIEFDMKLSYEDAKMKDRPTEIELLLKFSISGRKKQHKSDFEEFKTIFESSLLANKHNKDEQAEKIKKEIPQIQKFRNANLKNIKQL